MSLPIYQTASGALCAVAGPDTVMKDLGLAQDLPQVGEVMRHVADLTVVPVNDPSVYLFELAEEPPALEAAPPAEARLLVDLAQLAKEDPPTEERYILSMVLEPNDGTEDAPFAPDTQNDVYSASEIRKTAHGWMEKGGQVDLMHNWQPLGPRVRVLESYIAPVSFTLGNYPIRKGSWLLGLRVLDDNLWNNIKSGKIGAFSVGGTAIRKPVEGAPK